MLGQAEDIADKVRVDDLKKYSRILILEDISGVKQNECALRSVCTMKCHMSLALLPDSPTWETHSPAFGSNLSRLYLFGRRYSYVDSGSLASIALCFHACCFFSHQLDAMSLRKR